ncbi:hypothetical protein ACQJBY_051388 [Aegilops geniculata]
MVSGTAPDSMLYPTLITSRLSMSPMLSGSSPANSLWLRSSTLSFFSLPISGGMQELMLVLSKMSSTSVSAMSPMLGGRQPASLVLASTMTDAVELVRLPDVSDTLKRLSLANSASRLSCRPNTASGSSPSKSLNRRSRYLSDGKEVRKDGKAPERRLLLTSSSKRRRMCCMDVGSVPWNRLELRWRTARSARRPRWSVRTPAMRPWLRSTPATVRMHGSSGAAAQNTPV